MNLFSQDKSAFGLDISDESLKLVQLSKSRLGGFVVDAYSDAKIPKGTVLADEIKDPKKLGETIKHAMAKAEFGKITTKQVVASVPETKGFVRVIEMPAMTIDEAKEAIPWEAENYIPLPIEQVYLDWEILGRRSDKMKVLITASPRDYIESLVDVLRMINLQPVALELESQASARSLIKKDDQESTTLVLDIATVRTSVIIFDHGALHFTSSLPIAGNAFTESIAKALTVKTQEAEKLKREFGLDDKDHDGKIKKALRPVLNSLLNEVENTIKFYEEHSTEKTKIANLLLAGGSSKLKHLPSYLYDHLVEKNVNLHVELANPWVNIFGKQETPPLSRTDSLSYATALGLALRRFL